MYEITLYFKELWISSDTVYQMWKEKGIKFSFKFPHFL